MQKFLSSKEPIFILLPKHLIVQHLCIAQMKIKKKHIAITYCNLSN